VFARKFKFPHLQADVGRAGLPALVSESDPTDVEVLWDELPSPGSQIATRMSDSVADAQARTSQAIGAMPASGAAGLDALPPQMRQLAADNARRTLQFVQDPAQRQMLIEQYRAAGIVLDEGDETS
jgi:hypothetical protein